MLAIQIMSIKLNSDFYYKKMNVKSAAQNLVSYLTSVIFRVWVKSPARMR